MYISIQSQTSMNQNISYWFSIASVPHRDSLARVSTCLFCVFGSSRPNISSQERSVPAFACSFNSRINMITLKINMIFMSLISSWHIRLLSHILAHDNTTTKSCSQTLFRLWRRVASEKLLVLWQVNPCWERGQERQIKYDERDETGRGRIPTSLWNNSH